jgi:hypothetical protein
MKLSRRQLQPSDTPLIRFGGKQVNALGNISLSVSFGDQENARTEYVTFDIIDLYYPYNAIFDRGFANKLNMALHMGYLCMKIPALHGIITVHGNKKEARNIEKALYRSQRNINSVDIEPSDMPKGPTSLKDQEDTRLVPLEQVVLDRQVTIGANLSAKEEEELINTLAKNKDIFAWTASDLQGVSRAIMEHALDINPNMRPKKQWQRKILEDRILIAKVEVQRLLDANVIREVKYSD